MVPQTKMLTTCYRILMCIHHRQYIAILDNMFGFYSNLKEKLILTEVVLSDV